jgi:hypothetical protein
MKYNILLSAFLICLLSCNKKDDCKEQSIAIKHFESDYGCADTRHALTVNLNNSATIIRSKAEYDSQVSGSCHPEIDFSLFDLVIGQQSSGNSNASITYDLRRTCPEKELTLTVDIIQGLLTVPDNVVYHALIPKLGDEESLNIKIIVR